MTPREKFKNNTELVKGYNSIMDSVQMDAAFDAAMLEYAGSLEFSNDMDIASANHFRLQGARGFLAELKNLNTNRSPIKQPTSGQLDHTV